MENQFTFSSEIIRSLTPSDPRIIHNHPFYYCKEYPKVENIYLESIQHHLECPADHLQESIMEEKLV